MDFISQFTTDIRHISGQDNIVADSLSRIKAITAPVTHDALAAAQDDDDEIRTLLVSNTALQLENLLIPDTLVELYCDTSAGKPRPYISSPPSGIRLLTFPQPPRIKATAKLVSQRFVWPAI